MAVPATKRRLSASTAVAAVFGIAAGAVVWFGMTGNDSPATESSESLTVPGSDRPSGRTVGTVSTGGLPTRIIVPAAGVDAHIAEVGITFEAGEPAWETAWRAAGHHIDSAMPGQPGNMVISGHVSVADRANLAVFQRLQDVAEGDIVEVYSGETLYRYSIDRVVTVSPEAVKLLRSDSTATVTLVTCTEDLKNRLVVVGTLIA